MTRRRVYIHGMGIISPLGRGVDTTIAALRANLGALRPLQLFTPAHGKPLPVGEVHEQFESGPLPRCHQLAGIAAEEAMAGNPPPDAIVIGITTGGILTTENHLKSKSLNPALYQYHSLSSVAEEIARRFRCPGPSLTISTACSSGTAAIKIALEMIRSGQAQRVLVGGVDSLCRLTYFGFHSLQLVDPEGAKPFAANRKGMSVAEGAAMLLLEADQPDRALAEILGGGLSCDAYHPTAPQPQGVGAQQAMAAALADAGLTAGDIDYINLHGTGTPDNDQAEARAVHALFPDHTPPLSSIKGAMGHALGAAGAIEAVVAAIAVSRGFIPANTGGQEPDAALALTPLPTPMDLPIRTVLSNSFGFGGNNAAVIIAASVAPAPSLASATLSQSDRSTRDDRGGALRVCPNHSWERGHLARTVREKRARRPRSQAIVVHDFLPGQTRNAPDRDPTQHTKILPLAIIASACFTGAGATEQTMTRLALGESVAGLFPTEEIAKALPPRLVRRLKRLPRMALALTEAARPTGQSAPPTSVFMGTGWGPLSETHDFLERLFDTDEQFPSPTDFIGSVHNGPASQIAIHFQATGPNITTSAGDYSFEQALMAASLVAPAENESFFVLAADEYHPHLSPLFAPPHSRVALAADGGGAFCLRHHPTLTPPLTLRENEQKESANHARTQWITSAFYRRDDNSEQVIEALIEALGGGATIQAEYGLLLVGLPAACRGRAMEQLKHFLARSGLAAPVIDYRRLTGEFASASAVAAVMASNWLQQGRIPLTLAGSGNFTITQKTALILGLGQYVTAMVITAS